MTLTNLWSDHKRVLLASFTVLALAGALTLYFLRPETKSSADGDSWTPLPESPAKDGLQPEPGTEGQALDEQAGGPAGDPDSAALVASGRKAGQSRNARGEGAASGPAQDTGLAAGSKAGAQSQGGPSGGSHAALAPRPGTYRYSGTVDHGGQQSPANEQLHIAPMKTGSGDVTQSMSKDIYKREVSWRPDRMVESKMSAMGVACDWAPALVRYLAPLKLGLEWGHSSTCPGVQITESGNAKVTGKKIVTVEDKPVEVWVIERREKWVNGSNVTTTAETELFSSQYNLTIERGGTYTTESPPPPGALPLAQGTTQQYAANLKLVSLEPQT